MKLVTQLRIALLFILLVGLSSAALHYWNLQQSRYQIRKMNISHTVYEGYLNLESHIYHLFKQYGDAIIIGDSNQRASKTRLAAMRLPERQCECMPPDSRLARFQYWC